MAVAAVGTGLSLWGSSLWEGPPGGSKGKEAAKKPTPAWETDLAELGVPNAMESGFSCTATSDRDLLCQDGGRLVLKLNPANGKILWSYDRPATTEVSVGVEEFDGKVYTQARETADGDGDGIVALDLATGKVERRFEVPDLRDGFVATDSGVLVQSGPKELWLLNAKNPRPLARWKAGDDEIESIASNGKSVVMTVSSHEDDRAFAHISLEATDSSLSEHLAYAFAEGAPDAPRPPLRPIGAGTSTLYFAEGGSGPADEYVAVDRTDPETGIDLWKRIPLKSPTDLPMTVADDFAYAPSSNGMITAVDCRRDRIAWHKDSGARGISQLAVREGKIFLTDAQGRLHTLDALTGRHLSMGKPHRGSRDADSRNDPPPPVLIGDAAYVITPGNTLYRTPLPTRK
ncbi:PQQ-binding-like beta-propeller repeat protein [Streptomyces sp. BRA346]